MKKENEFSHSIMPEAKSTCSHLSFALPIDEKSVFIDLEETIQLDISVVLLLGPTVKDASGA